MFGDLRKQIEKLKIDNYPVKETAGPPPLYNNQSIPMVRDSKPESAGA